MTKPTACIIGYGRFGQVWEKVLSPGFNVVIDDYSEADFIFPCVPIRAFESVLADIAPHLKPGQTVADVCSVKLHPQEVMQQYLPEGVAGVLTHPLFGPDSYQNESARKIMMTPLGDTHESYRTLKSYLQGHSFELIEISADEHDKQAANSQAVTHFLGRVFDKAGLVPTKQITTLGFEKLLEVKEQTCHDSEELFEDMLKFNPYAYISIGRLGNAISVLED